MGARCAQPENERSGVISFDPFEIGLAAPGGSRTRGVAASLTAGCAAVLAGTLAPLAFLRVKAPAELAPMRVNSEQMWLWVRKGEYALAQAAADGRRFELQHAVELQTQIAFAMILPLCAYFFWRGAKNARSCGWSQFFWIAGVALAFFAPALAPGLTPQRLDYLASFWVETEDAHSGRSYLRILPPVACLAARALAAAATGGFLALCAHDVAHRLREALWEFGLISDDGRFSHVAPSSDYTPFKTAPGRAGASGGVYGAESGVEDGETRRFGSRAPSDLAAAVANPRAQACATLGVRLGASRAEIERAYRTKMKRAHPDHGGSVARAAALNMARDLLLRRG